MWIILAGFLCSYQSKKILWKYFFIMQINLIFPNLVESGFFSLTSCIYLSIQLSIFSFLFHSFFAEVLSVQSIEFKFCFVLSLVSHFPKIAISQSSFLSCPSSPIIIGKGGNLFWKFTIYILEGCTSMGGVKIKWG